MSNNLRGGPMSSLPHRLLALLPTTPFFGAGAAPPPPPPAASEAASEAKDDLSVEDVLAIKEHLRATSGLPLEAVDMIMDKAELWAVTTATADYAESHRESGGFLKVTSGRPQENQFLLRTPPIGLVRWSPADREVWGRAPDPARSVRTVGGGSAVRAEGEGEEEEEEEKREQEQQQQQQEESAASPSKEKLEKLTHSRGDDPLLEHPVRKIVFDITSHDQGWGGQGIRGRYENSWTWFDAGLDRFCEPAECPPDCPERQNPDYDPESSFPACAIRAVWPVLETPQAGTNGDHNNNNNIDNATTDNNDVAAPSFHHDLHPDEDHLIQRNRLATKEFHRHVVTWSCKDSDLPPDPTRSTESELKAQGRGTGTVDGDFVRSLRVGDMVSVWARTRFGGWLNAVQKVEVKVYWAV